MDITAVQDAENSTLRERIWVLGPACLSSESDRIVIGMVRKAWI
jgi:hypothetical protein